MSIFDKDLFGKSKHESALARIHTFCAGKRVLVAFSGGKDSQCCYHLCEEAGIEFVAQYSVTRFEPPELLQFIRAHYPHIKWRRAFRRTLIDEISLHGLPSRWMRWCCEAKHNATPGFDIAVVGVRAEESPKRAANWRAFGYKQDKTAYTCPIIDWTEADVWEYLSSKHVPHCVLYDPPYNFNRIGCVCCPLAPYHMLENAQMWPKTAAMLKMGARKFVDRMAAHGFITSTGRHCPDWSLADDPLEEFWQRWIHTGQTAMPINAAIDENEPCLFAGTGFSESDGEEIADA